MGQVASFFAEKGRAVVRAASKMIIHFTRHPIQHCMTIIGGLSSLPRQMLNYALAHPFRMLMHAANLFDLLLRFGTGGVIVGKSVYCFPPSHLAP